MTATRMPHSVRAMHNQISCLEPTEELPDLSMRAIITTPIAVSISTHGRIAWLAYGLHRSSSPHSTRNSAPTTASRPM